MLHQLIGKGRHDRLRRSPPPHPQRHEVDLRPAFELADDPAVGIDVGQSSDDVAELHAVLRRPADDMPVLWQDLQHLAGVLRLLAYLDLPAVNAATVDGGTRRHRCPLGS